MLHLNLVPMSLPQMSCIGAALICLILLLRKIFLLRLPHKTFFSLWSIALFRLLLPFSLFSVRSVYSLPAYSLRFAGKIQPVPDRYLLSSLRAVWLAGVFLCMTYFTAAYLICRMRFARSIPLEDDRVNTLLADIFSAKSPKTAPGKSQMRHILFGNWLDKNILARRVRIRQCEQIRTPLTYGILRPVILLPFPMNLKNTELLSFVLTHEMTHIRRGDALWKMLLVIACCLHWFNPFVWFMYCFANRDLELSCDRTVLRILGTASRAPYAKALLSMEEQKTFPCSFYSGFGRSPLEERILLIMKERKFSPHSAFLSAVLILTVVLVSGTFAHASQATEEKAHFWVMHFEGLSADSASLFLQKKSEVPPEYAQDIDPSLFTIGYLRILYPSLSTGHSKTVYLTPEKDYTDSSGTEMTLLIRMIEYDKDTSTDCWGLFAVFPTREKAVWETHMANTLYSFEPPE